ncbi:MAGE-like protein 2 [Aotus nancymaae]|uniref:MAGE-like protein 2 n=1 Tax=Aotus nancymaae TaxID=37293 RepID=UPI0030FE6461
MGCRGELRAASSEKRSLIPAPPSCCLPFPTSRPKLPGSSAPPPPPGEQIEASLSIERVPLLHPGDGGCPQAPPPCPGDPRCPRSPGHPHPADCDMPRCTPPVPRLSVAPAPSSTPLAPLAPGLQVR